MIFTANPCADSICHTPGTCMFDDDYIAKCKCPNGYGGEKCQNRMYTNIYHF